MSSPEIIRHIHKTIRTGSKMQKEPRKDERKERTAERARAGDLFKFAGLPLSLIKNADYIEDISKRTYSIISNIENDGISFVNKEGHKINLLETGRINFVKYKNTTMPAAAVIPAGAILIKTGILEFLERRKDGPENFYEKTIIIGAIMISIVLRESENSQD